MSQVRSALMTSPHSPAPLRLLLIAAIAAMAGTALPHAQNKEPESRRPKVTVRAQPSVAIAPARVVLTAEIVGGADDFEEYYCPTVEWEWGDDTSSEATADCDPYEVGKTQIKRRYTTQHIFKREGSFKVYFHLKRRDRILGSASTMLQVQPGGIRSF